MKLAIPKITVLPSSGLLRGRCSKAIFVTKHNLQINQDVVETETQQVTRPTAKNWLFLVEGHRRYHTVENLFLDSLAENFGIKTEDPIVQPFTSEIAEAASLEKIVGALSVLAMDYLDYIEQNNQIELVDNKTLELVFNQSVDVVAKLFGVSPDALKREFNELKWGGEEKLAEQLKVLSIKRNQLISESNSQSGKKLIESLRRNSHPNLFVMSGIEHAQVFTQEEIT